jgi:hypothetical protein
MDRELNIICQACEQPLGDNDSTFGNLWISHAEWHAYSDAYAEWEAEYVTKLEGGGESVTGAGIVTRPSRVTWRAHHSACDSGEEADLYSIPSPKLRTWADLVDWTAHLMEKTWLSDTTWAQMLRGVASADSSLIVPIVRPRLNS